MKKKTFKLGETVWFMQSNKPTSSTVTAVIKIEGKVKIDYTTYDSKDGEEITIYTAGFSNFKEEDLFTSIDLLKESVFNTVANEE